MFFRSRRRNETTPCVCISYLTTHDAPFLGSNPLPYPPAARIGAEGVCVLLLKRSRRRWPSRRSRRRAALYDGRLADDVGSVDRFRVGCHPEGLAQVTAALVDPFLEDVPTLVAQERGTYTEQQQQQQQQMSAYCTDGVHISFSCMRARMCGPRVLLF